MTDWNKTTNAQSGYVLYIEHDSAPHEVSIHNSLSGAEAALREYGEWFFGGSDEDIPADEDLTKRLTEFGEYARIYKCSIGDSDDGAYWGSVEVEPFIETEQQNTAAA